MTNNGNPMPVSQRCIIGPGISCVCLCVKHISTLPLLLEYLVEI